MTKMVTHHFPIHNPAFSLHCNGRFYAGVHWGITDLTKENPIMTTRNDLWSLEQTLSKWAREAKEQKNHYVKSADDSPEAQRLAHRYAGREQAFEEAMLAIREARLALATGTAIATKGDELFENVRSLKKTSSNDGPLQDVLSFESYAGSVCF